jgi:MoaA/NifB/PqqE/SkfB family radical SAM enzyme
MEMSPSGQSAEKAHHHLGWQITGRCNHACRYCLRRRNDKPTFELDANACAVVLDSYLDFLRRNDLFGSIMYSGGNPMLREDLPGLLETTRRAKDEGLVGHVSILANPETIDDAVAAHLAACRVDSVSISLDGRKEANDRMRGEGSFDAAIAGIRRLVGAGVGVSIKFTLSRLNANDVPYVFDTALALGVRSVGIGVMSKPNAADDLSDLMITPAEYRAHLLSMLAYDDAADEAQKRMIQSNLRFGRGLYALLFHELGRYDEFKERMQTADSQPGRREPMFGGPGGGLRRGMFVVWEDGSVHISNSQAQPVLGWVPQESFQRIQERRVAEGRDQSVARAPRDPRLANPTSAVCIACPVREFCPGDNRSCWKLNAEAANTIPV